MLVATYPQTKHKELIQKLYRNLTVMVSYFMLHVAVYVSY